MIGKTFGRLTVTGPADKGKFGHVQWMCHSSCGSVRPVEETALRRGHTKSCGCASRESVIGRSTTHGGASSPEYRVWAALKDRCLNPKDKGYYRYGGRGISVCEDWKTSFACFLADMGPRPSSEHSIERVDNSKGYSPSNCVWATATRQTRNTRARVTNRFGIKGVALTKSGNWHVNISVPLKRLNLGTFKDFFEACCARKSAEQLYWS